MTTLKRALSTLVAAIMCIAASVAQTLPSIVPQLGHPSPVLALDISHDGRYVISTSIDPVVLLWDIRSGKQIRAFYGHTDKVTSCAFSPDGKFAVSVDDDLTIIKWDVNTGGIVWKADIHGYRESIVFSPDGKFILVGGMNLELLDAETGEVVRKYDQFGYRDTNSKIHSVAFAPDGATFISGHDNGKIIVWKTDEEAYDHVLGAKGWGHSSSVTSVAYSADGSRIASGSWDKHLYLWDAASGEMLSGSLFWTSNGWITTVAISPDTKRVACGDEFASICSYDAEVPENHLTFDRQHGANIRAIKFTPDGKYLVSGSSDNTLIVWDAATGKMIKRLGGTAAVVFSAALSPDTKQIASGLIDGTVRVWDRLSGKETAVLAGHSMPVNVVRFTTDGKRILSGSGGIDQDILSTRRDVNDYSIRLWDVAAQKEVKKFDGHTMYVRGLDVAPDGKTFLSTSVDRSLKLWDFNKSEPLYTYSEQTPVNNAVFTADGSKAYVSSYAQETLLDLATKTATPIDRENGMETKRCTLSGDGKMLGWITYGQMEFYDCVQKRKMDLPVKHDFQVHSTCLAFSKSGRLIADGTEDNTIRIIDLEKKEVRPYLVGHKGRINSVAITDDDKYVVSASSDGTVRVWDLATGRWVALLSHTNRRDWLAYTDDGYWDASPKGGELVAMVQGSESWNIDQFAVKTNRPDIILERLGSHDQQSIVHYQTQYRKRLRRLGLTEEQPASAGSYPTSEITQSAVSGKICELGIHLHDEEYALKRYNVYVNDVPLFGASGKAVDDDDIECTEKFELTQGDNKIEVSCMNEKGIESFRAVTYAAYAEPVKRDLYVLAFGVSLYQNEAYDLQYADKDARDFAGVMASLEGKGFEHVYTRALTNEEVTPEALRESKAFVKEAKPDDYFILFIAGHGMHDADAEATYYYLTANADVKSLKTTAADFETVEDLLQNIAPRNKLFLMDACESGELDPEEQEVMTARAAGAGMASRGFKAARVQSALSAAAPSGLKRSYLYEKNRYIYNDLVRRSGAVVFSSSKGGELSYERSDLRNGLFTNSLLKAISGGMADKDNDGRVSIDELREFVAGDVAKASGELQHPTIDRDNIYQKLDFMIK